MRGIAYIQLIRIQDIIRKSDFDIYHQVTIFNFPQNLAMSHYISGGFLRILVPSQILAPPSISERNQIATAQLELINFQDARHKCHFDTYYANFFLICQKS